MSEAGQEPSREGAPRDMLTMPVRQYNKICNRQGANGCFLGLIAGGILHEYPPLLFGVGLLALAFVWISFWTDKDEDRPRDVP